MATPEGLVVKAICRYLDLQERLGVLWYARINNGAIYDASRCSYRKFSGAGYKRGVPDIICCFKGRLIGLEVKSAVGTQSEFQKDIEKALTKNGGLYFVVRSVKDVEAALRVVGLQASHGLICNPL